MVNTIPVLEYINEQMKAVVAASNKLYENMPPDNGSLEQMRENYLVERRFWNEGGPVPQSIIDDTVETRHGLVEVRRYVPQGVHTTGGQKQDGEQAGATPLAPALIYLHGGGFVLGNLDTHNRIMRILAEKTGAVVVGVNYTLSPEAKFPVALEQCVDVALFIHRQGTAWGLDGQNISFAGDSCGAYLCLAATLYLRDTLGGEASAHATGGQVDTQTGGQADTQTGTEANNPLGFIRSLLLYYGLFGLRDSAARRYLGGPWDGLSAEDIEWYYRSYVDKPGDMQSPYVDCLSANLSGDFPPCYIVAAEFDPLKDDSFALASILDWHAKGCSVAGGQDFAKGQSVAGGQDFAKGQGVSGNQAAQKSPHQSLRQSPHQLEVFDGVLHAFLHNSRMLEEASRALENGAAFYRATALV